ncbi:MAG: hypothetical protein ABI353_05920 [Isosphaeraceae bacterium]
MWRNNLARIVTAVLAAGILVGANADQALGQAYTSTNGGGYYANPGGGYYYPSYAYGYQTSTGATLPSGYYAYPNGSGGYYYQYYAPQTQAARPTTARPAARPPVAAAQLSTASTRVLALEARVRSLEARVNNLISAASTRAATTYQAVSTAPSYTYTEPGNPNVERDSRYPNYSFDYSSWLAHNL